MNLPLYPASKQPVQINVIPIYQFIKKLCHEKFKISFLFRGRIDPVINLPGTSSGSSGDSNKNRVL
jgi:hypothetical protein